VAIELAGSFPDRVDRAVLVNCPYYPDRTSANVSHTPLKSGLRPSDASGFPTTRTIEFMLQQDPAHAPMRPSQSWMDRINVAQLEVGRDRWQALDALAGFDVASKLQRMQCPVLLLIGEHFHYVQFRDAFAARIQALQVDILKHGRFCMTWERADDVGQRAIAFVQ
jgi:pimeloyl-ACP methyl ester carboxylesterase